MGVYAKLLEIQQAIKAPKGQQDVYTCPVCAIFLERMLKK